MDILDEDLIAFWRQLFLDEVKYIMIGGFAVRVHGYDRGTDDLDIWIENSLENRKRLRKSFSNLNYGDFEEFETIEFVPGWTSFYIGGINIDILTDMKGLESLSFNDCYELALHQEIENIPIKFLHINHLIQNKLATNRPKDKLDVEYLTQILNSKD